MHHDPAITGVLPVTAALAAIVVSAQVCGLLARRLGQPAVVGEMVAGVLLGPTLLGALAPAASDYMFSDTTKPTLYAMSMVGLSLYMFMVGMEHEHPRESRRDMILPIVLATSGMIGPILIGSLAALMITDDLRPHGISPTLHAVFIGGALSVAAFPMLARVLQEQDMVRTRFGRVATSAAAIDDALAWCVLAVCGALAVQGNLAGSLKTIVPAIGLVLLAFMLLPRLFAGPMQRSVSEGRISDALFASMITLVLGVGFLADYIGIYSVFGGFVCGFTLPKVPGFAEMFTGITAKLVRMLLLPIFFAYSGLNTDLGEVFAPKYLLPTVVLLLVAIVAKSGASYLVLRIGFRWNRGEAVAMGALMNARGLMILIFINAGLALGIISRPVFSMLVVVAVITTGLALPVYRRHFTPRAEAEAREQEQHSHAIVETRPAPATAPAEPVTSLV